jgi:CRP-like cAMP-binding protein
MATERQRFQFFGSVPLLERVDDTVLWALAYEGTNETFPARHFVLEAGKREDEMRFYIVRDGDALVLTDEVLEGSWIDADGLTRSAEGERVSIDPVTGKRVLATLRPGDFFGESALLTNNVRSATVRAGTLGLDVVSFDSRTFHARIAEHVLVFRMVRNEFAAGELPDMRSLGLFNGMSMTDLSAVLHDSKQEQFAVGDAIIREGDSGDRFYIILDGEVLVSRDGDAVVRLERGDYFGELALLLVAPRSASVTATRPTTCWSLTAESFNLIVRNQLLFDHAPVTPRQWTEVGTSSNSILTPGAIAARLRRSS